MHHLHLSSRHLLFGAAIVAALSFASTASAAPTSDAPKVSLFAGAGYLASPGANGAAIEVGARFAVARDVALDFDLGYGVLAAAAGPTVQDRWWIMPALAYVIPAGRVRLDLGAGVGLGASSGYRSWSSYIDQPFMPVWAYQLMPTLRVHAAAWYDLSPRSSVFTRVEAAKLLMSGSDSKWMDTTWATLSIGAAVDVW
jgi:hypothetical protein